jgi:mannosyltransferase OCH1-like enzyme
MPITPTIYQTFKTANLPWHTRWHIYWLKQNNPEYRYEFFDDDRVSDFILSAFGTEVSNLYQRINIGAAKADFFRYAVLYKNGGVYLDIDSRAKRKLNSFLLPTDAALISKENNGSNFYIQWCLMYCPGHPFLERTILNVCNNIALNKYPNDVHRTTGPSVYTQSILECLKETPSIPHRELGKDFEGNMQFKYPLSKLMYKKGEHWKATTKPLLKH